MFREIRGMVNGETQKGIIPALKALAMTICGKTKSLPDSGDGLHNKTSST